MSGTAKVLACKTILRICCRSFSKYFGITEEINARSGEMVVLGRAKCLRNLEKDY